MNSASLPLLNVFRSSPIKTDLNGCFDLNLKLNDVKLNFFTRCKTLLHYREADVGIMHQCSGSNLESNADHIANDEFFGFLFKTSQSKRIAKATVEKHLD